MSYKYNKHPEELVIGQKVTTTYNYDDKDLIREIVDIEKDPGYGSGIRIKMSTEYTGILSSPISKTIPEWVDATWGLPLDEPLKTL